MFSRLSPLLPPGGLDRLADAHVVVFGVGGVGSWAVEALARSGVGHLRLVDFDVVDPSNRNRQLPSLDHTTGQPKAQVLAARVREINPAARVEVRQERYQAVTADTLLDGQIDYVIDAIDEVEAKCHLLATCVARGLPVASSMGAGGRLDPTGIQIVDLADTQVDPLARRVRTVLRRQHGLPRTGPMGITAVYTPRPRVSPGTTAFVTGAFGLALASVVVGRLSQPS